MTAASPPTASSGAGRDIFRASWVRVACAALAAAVVSATTFAVVPAVGEPGNGPSGGLPPVTRDQAVSADGRWVAFASDATDLVEGDTNGTRDMFLRDMAAGSTIRIPWLANLQLPGELAAMQPSISAQGQFVAFAVGRTQVASEVDLGMTFPAIVLYDRDANVTSVAAWGVDPSISGDGRHLAYATTAMTGSQVVLRDLETGSESVIPTGAAGSAQQPSISPDGRFIAFTAPATGTAAAGTSSGQSEVYRFERATGQLIRISTALAGVPTDGASFNPSISAEGDRIAFASTATNLVDTGGLNGTSQVFVWEQSTGKIRLISSDRTGAAGRGASLAPSISWSGRFVAFQSAAPDLEAVGIPSAGATVAPVAGEGSALRTTAVWVRDTVNGQLARVSVDATGRATPGDSGRPSISGDGMVVAYDSMSAALVPGDTNGARDVFIRTWSPDATVEPNPLDFGPVQVGGRAGVRTVAVIGAGWAPFKVLNATLSDSPTGEFVIASDGCANTVLYFSDRCAIQVRFAPAGPRTRSATLVIEGSAPIGPRSVQLVGFGTSTPPVTPVPATPGPGGGMGIPGGPPSLVLDPPLGPPGFVTTVTGSGFPPGARVSLRWDQGITGAGNVVIAGGDGTFRVGVLIFPKSAHGPRELVASSAGGPDFADTSARFLVVAGTAQPFGSGAVRFISPEVHPIIIRP